MALISCPDCNADVSTLAIQCAKCGRPVATMASRESLRQAAEDEERRRSMPWKIVFAIVMIGAFAATFVRPSNSGGPATDASLTADVAAATQQGRLPDRAGAPGPNWVRVLPGQDVFATPDSIRKLGPDTYRAVILTELGDVSRTVDTDEIRCSEHTVRNIRVLMIGKHVRRARAETLFPGDAFDAVDRGGPADVKYQNICALARKKFGDTRLPDVPAPPRRMSDEEAKAGLVRLAFALDMTNKFRAKGFTLIAGGITATDLRVDCPKCTSDVATQFGADDNIQATSRRLGFKRIIFNAAGQNSRRWTP